MAKPKPIRPMEKPTETPNDVKTKRNKEARYQYYGGYLDTSLARSMSQ